MFLNPVLAEYSYSGLDWRAIPPTRTWNKERSVKSAELVGSNYFFFALSFSFFQVFNAAWIFSGSTIVFFFLSWIKFFHLWWTLFYIFWIWNRDTDLKLKLNWTLRLSLNGKTEAYCETDFKLLKSECLWGTKFKTETLILEFSVWKSLLMSVFGIWTLIWVFEFSYPFVILSLYYSIYSLLFLCFGSVISLPI